MKKLSLALFSLAFAGVLMTSGCGKMIPMSEFEGVRDKICACEDKACAEGIVDEVKRLKTLGNSVENEEKAQALMQEAGMCAGKLAGPDLITKLQEAL